MNKDNRNDSNIISDEDFMNEIMGNAPAEETQQPELTPDQEFIERVLNGNLESPSTTPDNEEPSEDSNKETETDTTSEEVSTQEKETFKRFGVKDTVTTLIENEVWVDMPIKYGDKEYENISELIDKEKPSKELFELLSVAQKQYRDAQIEDSYIKLDDKNSHKAKLVQAIVNDVDYSDLLEYNTEVIEPLTRIDFAMLPNAEQVAEAFVRNCLVEIDNFHPASIDLAIQTLKKDMTLIDKAEEYQKITIDNFNKEIDKRNFEKAEQVRLKEEEVRNDMKALRAELKANSLSDAFSSKILKLRYSIDPSSGKYHYENLISEKIKDKNFEARFMHFLLDENGFIDKEKSKVKTEASKRIMELVNIVPSSKGGKASPKPSTNLQNDDEEFLQSIGVI